MCSVGEDDFGDVGGVHAMIPDQKTDVVDEICTKCNIDKTVVKLTNFKAAQCKNCFVLHVRHKFRAAIGSAKIVKRESNVLVIFDGSPENIVLLELLNFSLSEVSYKRLHLTVSTLFVDDLFLSGLSEEQRKAHLENARQLLTNFNFKSYYLSIAEETAHEFLESVPLSATENSFAETFNGIKSLTSRQEYLHQLKQKKIRHTAQSLDCQYVFTSDISENLSKTFLTNIALGRGSSVAQDLSFCDDRDDDVKIIRPMRDLNINEITNYIALNSLTTLPAQIYGQNSDAHSSLQNLTSKFVDDLQKDFSSTVSTVYRTGDKIAAKQNSCKSTVDDKLENLKLNDVGICIFCKSTLDFFNSDTLFAIEYSRLVSANSSSSNNQEENVKQLEERARNAVDGISCLDGDQDNDVEDLKKRLCHGCRNIFQDMDDTSNIFNE